MLSAVALFCWFVFFAYVIYRIIRNRAVSMTFPEVILAFGCKVLAGFVYGYVFLHYYNGDDTWLLHSDSIRETQMLLTNPGQFFLEVTPLPAIRNGDGLVNILHLYQMDLEYSLQAKLLGIINLVSGSNYYINVVFWNFFIFWGHYWLFRTLVTASPTTRGRYYLLIFLFPPVLFWLSGLRSDGMLFFFFSLFVYSFQKWLTSGGYKRIVFWVIAFTGLLVFRSPFAALLTPAATGWLLSVRFKRRPLLAFGAVYGIGLMIFFGSSLLPDLNLPAKVANRQHEFMLLNGTAFELDRLEPTATSFATVFPQALYNTFLRPQPWEADGLLQALASVEVVIFWLVLMLAILLRAPGWRDFLANPLLIALLLFAISLYIFIGYVVPFPGAIVRYKIIAELLLLSILLTVIKTGAIR